MIYIGECLDLWSNTLDGYYIYRYNVRSNRFVAISRVYRRIMFGTVISFYKL